MSGRKEPQNKDGGIWLTGLILVAAAIYEFLKLDFTSFVFLLILGVGLMAYESAEFRGEMFHLFKEILEEILKRIGLLNE